jgi:hypothetical protein
MSASILGRGAGRILVVASAIALQALAGCGSGDDAPTSTSQGAGAGTTTSSGAGAGGGAASSTGAGAGGAQGSGGQGGSGAQGGASASSSSTGNPLPQPCPPDMALVGTTCMDFYEAPNQKGAEPIVMQSALDGETWCEGVGKRLCTEDEWDIACAGPQNYIYPYGNSHIPSHCNDDKMWKVVNEGALNTWPSAAAQAEVDKLYQGAPSGSYDECVSGYGVFDLTGNIEEWVVRTKPHQNNYPHVLKGCYWAGCYGGTKPKCSSTNPAHASAFRYYETGFRCCKDADL